MLAIVSIQLHNGTPQGAVHFAEELREFGWKQHPQMSDVFVAEFPPKSLQRDVLATVCSDIGMSFGVAEAESWSGSVGLARRSPTATALSWE